MYVSSVIHIAFCDMVQCYNVYMLLLYVNICVIVPIISNENMFFWVQDHPQWFKEQSILTIKYNTQKIDVKSFYLIEITICTRDVSV